MSTHPAVPMIVLTSRPLQMDLTKEQKETFLRLVDDIRSFRLLDEALIPYIESYAQESLLPGGDNIDSLSFDAQSLRESLNEFNIFLESLQLSKSHPCYSVAMQMLTAENVQLKEDEGPSKDQLVPLNEPPKEASKKVKRNKSPRKKAEPIVKAEKSPAKEPARTSPSRASKSRGEQKKVQSLEKTRTRQSTGISGFTRPHSRQLTSVFPTHEENSLINNEENGIDLGDFDAQRRVVLNDALSQQDSKHKHYPSVDPSEYQPLFHHEQDSHKMAPTHKFPKAEPILRLPLTSHRVSFHLSQLICPMTAPSNMRGPTRAFRRLASRPITHHASTTLQPHSHLLLVAPEPLKPKFAITHLPSRLQGVSPVILDLLKKTTIESNDIHNSLFPLECKFKLPPIF